MGFMRGAAVIICFGITAHLYAGVLPRRLGEWSHVSELQLSDTRKLWERCISVSDQHADGVFLCGHTAGAIALRISRTGIGDVHFPNLPDPALWSDGSDNVARETDSY